MTFRSRSHHFLLFVVVLLTASHAVGQWASPSAATTAAGFPPVDQWKAAVVSGNATTLKTIYSSNPPAQIKTGAGDLSGDADIAFWTGLKVRRLKLDIAKSESPQTGMQQVLFQAEVHSGAGGADHVVYINSVQLWQQQNGQWRLLAAQRSDPAKLQQPLSTTEILYAPNLDARADIKQALARAAKEHKHVILIFGANWCYDCHVLDLAFHRPELAAVLQKGYEVVHVDVGEYNKNMDLADQYQVPLKKGVPALAVLDGNGKLLYSQQSGEFEKARSLAPQDLLAFLNKWKPS